MKITSVPGIWSLVICFIISCFFFLTVEAQCPAGQRRVTITIRTDRFGSETTWGLYTQATSALIASGGPYGNNTTYTSQICVDTTICYYFTIYDQFSDGIALYDPGYYTVTYGSTVMGTGGNFGFSNTVLSIGSCTFPPPVVSSNTTYTPQQLVNDVLLGSCVTAFNVSYTGAPAAIGNFSNGAALGIDNGLLLTTGNTAIAPGPNRVSEAGYAPGTPGDPTLEAVSGVTPTYNAASLEFEFIPFNDTITFRYIFASEEYNEYVCAAGNYNDAFAFLITGPGYAPNTNVALVPGTSTPVAINSVNNGTPGIFNGFPNNPVNCISLSNASYFVDNTAGLITEFDGYTVPLIATMVVIPCDTYHIKIVIADVGDQKSDSGVFLEAESFSAGTGTAKITASAIDGTKNSYEGCSDGIFTFSREDTSNISDAIIINFTLLGSATEGTDFQIIPHSITILPNQLTADINIVSFLDVIVEGYETVIISFPDACSCTSFKRDTLFIFDNQPLNAVITGDSSLCYGESTILAATGSGSASTPFHYSWNSGQDSASITVSPVSTTTYTVTITDACAAQTATDSYTVTVAPQITSAFNFSICEGDSLFAGGGFQHLSRTYLDTVTAANGCDSIITTALTVFDTSVTTIALAICSGDSIFLGGAWQYSSVSFTNILINSDYCDSTVITTLDVLNHTLTSLSISICEGDSAFAGGGFKNVSGTYHDTLPAANGCDSVVITSLTVNDTSVTNIALSICSGDSIFAGGSWQFSSGIYYDVHFNFNGCDSTVINTLDVLNHSLTSLSISICEGDSVFAGGSFHTATGIYRDTLPATNGCDSVVITSLTVNDTSVTNIALSICSGDSVFAGGSWQLSSGIYFDVHSNFNGCDSTVITTLDVLNHSLTSLNISICEGDSVFAGGDFQNVSGIYRDTLPAANGCDSVVTTSLTVNDTSVTNLAVSICSGDSVFAGGSWQFSSDIYYDVHSNFNGCDSTVITALDVLNHSLTSLSISICEGDSAFAGGDFQHVSGTYLDTLPAANGCDSVVTTLLTVNDTSVTMVNTFICEGDSLFIGGAWQKLAGNYFDVLTSSSGCDSTVITHLAVDSIISIYIDATICFGDSIFAGGAFQNSPGAYVDIYLATGGCDSIVTTNVFVADTFLTNINITICAGDSILAEGVWQHASGIYVDRFTSVVGCDSNVITNLTVNPLMQIILDASICEGQNYFAGGAAQTSSGIYTDGYLASTGCDSIVITNLNVSDTFLNVFNVSICADDSFFAGGTWQKFPGSYTDFLTSISNCDSIIITHLEVDSIINTAINIFICEGENYFAGGGMQTTSGVFTDTFNSAVGCDSIVITTLSVLDTSLITITTTICRGDSIFAAGTWRKDAGIYVDSLLMVNGCDSLVIINLFVTNIPYTQEDTAICFGDSVFIAGAFQKTMGTYADTFISTGGCDSIHVIILSVIQINISGDTSTLCPGNSMTIVAPAGFAAYHWSPGGESTPSITVFPGSYQLMVTDANGCSAITDFVINEFNSIGLYAVPDSARITEGESVQIQILHSTSSSVSNYVWTPVDGLSCVTCSTTVATPLDDIIYTIVASDNNGCSETVTILIYVDTMETPAFYIPNAFTPNGDGINDDFRIYGRGFTSFILKVFDRWGEKLFETSNPTTGWDGTFRGQPCNPGVYVYYVDARFINNFYPTNFRKYQKGSVTLIR